MDAIPQKGASVEGTKRGPFGGSPAGGILATKIFHQALGKGAVLATIEFDVAIEIVPKVIDSTPHHGQSIDDPAKDIGQEVLTPESEGRGDGVKVALFYCPECLGKELSRGLRNVGDLDRPDHVAAPADLPNKAVDAIGPSTDGPHGFEIEFKMARVSASTVGVGLLGEDDLIDQPARPRVGRRGPGDVHATKPTL